MLPPSQQKDRKGPRWPVIEWSILANWVRRPKVSDMELDKASDKGRRRPLIQSPNTGVPVQPWDWVVLWLSRSWLSQPKVPSLSLQYLVKSGWYWRCWFTCPLFLLLIPEYPASLLKPTCISKEHFKEATECRNMDASLSSEKLSLVQESQ